MIPNFIKRSIDNLHGREQKRRKRSIAKRSIKCLSVTKYIDLPEGEAVAVLLSRDMSHYLEGFYEYYRRLGVNYFIFLDNGSSDNSLDIVDKWNNAVVLTSDLNFRLFQNELRQIISTEYCSDGWRLAVDPDEQFDYIGSDKLSLQALLQSLSVDGYTGLVAQMLDLVPEFSLDGLAKMTFHNSWDSHVYYSLDDIDCLSYFDERVPFHGLIKDNVVISPEVYWKFGGVRRTYFAEYCCLTKHPVFLYRAGVEPFVHPHLTTGLKIADFTALLRHYKFSGNYVAREASLLAQQRVSHGETAKRASVMGTDGNFRFDTSNFLKGPTPIAALENGFISMSDRARRRYL